MCAVMLDPFPHTGLCEIKGRSFYSPSRIFFFSVLTSTIFYVESGHIFPLPTRCGSKEGLILSCSSARDGRPSGRIRPRGRALRRGARRHPPGPAPRFPLFSFRQPTTFSPPEACPPPPGILEQGSGCNLRHLLTPTHCRSLPSTLPPAIHLLF